MKLYRHCKQMKPLEDFHKNNQQKDGRHPYCKPCKTIRTKPQRKAKYDRLKDDADHQTKQKIWRDKGKKNHAAKSKIWYATQGGKEKRATYYQEHKEKLDRINRDFIKANPEKRKLYARRMLPQHRRVRQATRPWTETEAIRDFYDNAPPGYQVDHIIPLAGKYVCGLHVLGNLQYLTISENARKGNRYEPGFIEKLDAVQKGLSL